MLEIDMHSDVPIYQQIRNQIVYLTATGELKPDEPMPSVRQLAADIGVNPMTVNKAYALLKEDGIIVTDRRRGAKIAADVVAHTEGTKLFDRDFDDRFRLLISEAITRGATKEEIERHLRSLLQGAFGKEL